MHHRNAKFQLSYILNFVIFVLIMKSILIGYDLNKAGQDYTGLIDKIEKTFNIWWHHLDSTWIVKTDLTCVQIRDILAPFVDSNDELLVVELSGVGAWHGFNEKGSKWLKDNL